MSVLGKRRRDADSTEKSSTASELDDDDAKERALFQRAFEAKFKPLEQKPPTSKKSIADQDEDASDGNDDWDGLSEESEPDIEIVQVRDPTSNNVQATQPLDMKAFLSSKLPASSIKAIGSSSKRKKPADDDASEEANLKNDVALQRLLKESHLLDASSYNSTGTDVQGKSRLKALDLRIQDLGGKSSHLEQKKMPLSHRKGIVEKAANREQKRRKEAAENGIILEKAKLLSKSARPRDSGLGGPTLGRFKGGMLKLSSKDLKGIERSGPNDRGRRKGRGR